MQFYMRLQSHKTDRTRWLVFSFFMILMCVMQLSGCGSKVDKAELCNYKWIMDTAYTKSGEMLASQSTEDTEEITQLDVEIIFEQDLTFTIEDNTNDIQWKGKYTTEKASDSIKLELNFDDSENSILGVYGIIYYYDKTEQRTITLDFEDYTLTFTGSIND